MACKGSTGSGVTLSLSIDTTIARIRSVQLPEWLAEAVDFTGLGNTDWMCFVPGNPADPGSFTAELFFDSEIAIPTINLVQVATFTFPIQTTGNTTNATLTGTGFVTGLGWPNAAVGGPVLQSGTFKVDGGSAPPAFTLEAA